MKAFLRGGSHDGLCLTLNHLRDVIDMPTYSRFLIDDVGVIDPATLPAADRERYVYDSHDGPECLLYRLEGMPSL